MKNKQGSGPKSKGGLPREKKVRKEKPDDNMILDAFKDEDLGFITGFQELTPEECTVLGLDVKAPPPKKEKVVVAKKQEENKKRKPDVAKKEKEEKEQPAKKKKKPAKKLAKQAEKAAKEQAEKEQGKEKENEDAATEENEEEETGEKKLSYKQRKRQANKLKMFLRAKDKRATEAKEKMEVDEDSEEEEGEEVKKAAKKPAGKKGKKQAAVAEVEETEQDDECPELVGESGGEEEESSGEESGEEEEEKAAPGVKRVEDMSEWANFFLPDEVIDALADMGFAKPTEIQQLVLPSAVRDRLDILGAAETGSGKTLAYLIPAITRLLQSQPDEGEEEGGESEEKEKTGKRAQRGPRCMVLAPTRELVVQVRGQLDKLLAYTKMRATSIVGGLSQQKQERLMKLSPEFVVATPGRLWAMMQNADPGTYLGMLSSVECLIVDETDRMVERGHFEEMESILREVNNAAGEKLQTLVFSATLTYVHPAPKWMDKNKAVTLTPEQKLKRLIEITGLRKQRKIVDITREMGTAESLVETRINCANLLEKDAAVLYLLTRYSGRTLVFTNSIDAARRLHGVLSRCRPDKLPLLIHARMHQKQRLKNLEMFSSQADAVLLATDVAARGLDIQAIEHVIHYQVPKTAELYIHRSGRTARAASRGLAVLLVDPNDAGFYRRICNNLNRDHDVPVFPIDAPEVMRAVKERARLATEIDSCEYKIKKIKTRETWFEKNAAAADIDLVETHREREFDMSNTEAMNLYRRSKAAAAELRASLATPLPRIDRTAIPKTRYMTADIAKMLDVTKPEDALGTVEVMEGQMREDRKKCRALLTTRQVTSKDKKKKKGAGAKGYRKKKLAKKMR